MNTKNILAKLKDLLGKAGEMLFERVTLAAQAFTDKDWIQEACEGDDFKAAELLAAYFPDVCHGRVSFLNIMRLKQRFQTVDEWRKYKFNLIAMFDVLDSESTEEKTPHDSRRRATVKELEERDETIRDLSLRIAREEKRIAEKEAEVERLREQVVELRHENAVLKGRLTELERFFDMQQVV